MRPLYLLLLVFASCKAKPVKKKYTGPCKPFTVEELTSVRLRHNAEFITVVDASFYPEKEDFEKRFLPSPDIDFSTYAVGAILLDNKVAVLDHGQPALHDIHLTLKIDSSYMKNCELNLVFTANRWEDSIPPDGYKKKFFLFKVPKDSGIVKVNIISSTKTASWSFKLD